MNKILILGIDGATFDLMKPWMEQGYLPNFKRFMEGGTAGYLRTTIPPLTPSAWTSFMTGLTPERHEVFDFYYLDVDFKIKVSTKAKGVKTIWRLPSQEWPVRTPRPRMEKAADGGYIVRSLALLAAVW